MESRTHGEEDIDLQKVGLILKRRWLAIVGVCGISVALAAYHYSQQDHIYQAQGKLLVNKVNRASSLTGISKPDADTINPLGQQSNPLNTEAEVIRSIPIAQETITALKLKNEAGEPLMPQQLLGQLSVKSISSTDVLELSYKSIDPKEAAAVVNKVMDVYIQNEIRINQAEAGSARKFIADQLPKTEKQLKDIEEQLRQFKEKNNVVALQQEAESAVTVIANLDQKIADTQAQLADATAASRALQNKLGIDSQQAIALSSLSQSTGVQRALEELQKGQTELATARSLYEDIHPTVANLKLKEAYLRELLQEQVRQVLGSQEQESIANLQFGETQQKLTADLVEAEVKRLGLSSQVDSLSNVKLAYKERVSDIPQLEQKQQELERQRQATQSTYITLSQRLQEVKVKENENVGNVRLISKAIAPTSPIAPEKMKILGLGGASGLLLGIALAFLLDLGDASIRTIKEAREKFKYTVLGTIPMYGDTPRRGLFQLPNRGEADSTARAVPVRDTPRSPVGEAYRMLQANLKFLNSDRQIKVIVVGSSVPNEGKSSVSANLAATMAQLGRRILLIDADLHRPTQHHIWQLTNQVGLSNVLVGQVEFAEAVQTPIERLDVLPSGAIPPNPLALLDSKRMTSLVESFAEQYDFVIIDAPPLLVAADALTLGNMTDGMLLVVRPGTIDSASANKTKELLQQSGQNVLGLVINGVFSEHESDRFFYYMKTYHAAEIDASAWEGVTPNSTSNAKN